MKSILSWLRRPLFLLVSAALAGWVWLTVGVCLLPYDGSLGFTLTTTGPGIALAAVTLAALTLATAGLGLLCCRVSRSPLASLFAVAVGPAVLALNSGSIRDRLLSLHDPIPGHYIPFAIEAAFLQSLFVVLAIVTSLASRKNHEHPNPILNPPNSASIATAAMTAMLAFIFTCFLLQSDQPSQVGFGVVAAFALGTLIANLTAPSHDRILPSLISPALVAIVGYLQTRYAYADSNAWLQKLFSGHLLGIALPLPLQYITFGTLGVLLGTFISKTFMTDVNEA